MGYPENCRMCADEKMEPVIGGLKLSVKPFKQGDNPVIMLVGLNPTLIKKRANTVFELDNVNSPIYKFIVSDILEPTGITLGDIYATNLVKCTFKDEPRNISENISGKSDTKAVMKVLAPFFNHCRRYFFEELQVMKPRLVIAFGEKTHQFIVKELDLAKQNVKPNMKDAFGNIYRVKILDREVYYAPCIREVAKAHLKLQKSWDPFITAIKDTIRSADF